jgi:Mor family transcriptional regulator
VHHDLIAAIQNINARSVWASARRQGMWHNLNIYYYLGTGASADAKRRTERIFHELDGLLANMLDDDDFATAHEFISEVRQNVEYWREQFLEVVNREGQETFRPALQDENALWSKCETRWGGGSGYRFDVGEIVREWFENREQLHKALEAKIKRTWRREILAPLRELCNETTPAGEDIED